MSDKWDEETIKNLIKSMSADVNFPIDALCSKGRGRINGYETVFNMADYLIQGYASNLSIYQYDALPLHSRRHRKHRQNPFKHRD